jgi:hypothetical protein
MAGIHIMRVVRRSVIVRVVEEGVVEGIVGVVVRVVVVAPIGTAVEQADGKTEP